MVGLKQSGSFTIEPATLETIRADFTAGATTMNEAAATIRDTLAAAGYLLDPHSATALHTAREHESPSSPMVVLATAHPAKFPDAVKAACGVDPALPAWLSDLMQRTEEFQVLPSDLKILEDHVEDRARAAA
jgi:threonine synthase